MLYVFRVKLYAFYIGLMSFAGFAYVCYACLVISQLASNSSSVWLTIQVD